MKANKVIVTTKQPIVIFQATLGEIHQLREVIAIAKRQQHHERYHGPSISHLEKKFKRLFEDAKNRIDQKREKAVDKLIDEVSGPDTY